MMMRSPEELREYFNSTLLDVIKPYESKRTGAQLIIGMLVCVEISVSILLGIILGSQYLIPIIVVNVIIILAVCWFIVRAIEGNFYQDVVGAMIRFIHPSFSYDPKESIQLNNFLQSGLFHISPNVFQGRDLVKGALGGYDLQISDISSSFITKSVSQGRKSRPIFNGVLMEVAYQRPLKGNVYIFPDTTYQLGMISDWIQSINIASRKLIKIDHQEFEKLFVVYGEDEESVRQVLSDKLISKLIELKTMLSVPIRISIVDSKLYIALQGYRNIPDIHIFKSLVSFDAVEKYYKDVSLLISVADVLNRDIE